MKIPALLIALSLTPSAFATTCYVQMRSNLGITIMTDGERITDNTRVRFIFDDVNECDLRTGSCTEAAAPGVMALLVDVTPRGRVGAQVLKLTDLTVDSDYEYEPTKAMKKFAANARFVKTVTRETNLTLVYRGKRYKMSCF